MWGEGELYGKRNMETYITICKIDSQWEFAVCLRKLKQGLCINLEPFIQSEASQKEENKYCILTHIFGIQKPGVDEPICRAAIDTDTENGLVATVGKE